jgi:hypothetical protein
VKQSDSIGWGIFYDPDLSHATSDKAEQLVLVYVTYNDSIVDALFLLQPEGGLFPLVLLQPWGRRVKLDLHRQKDVAHHTAKLLKFHATKLGPALELYQKDAQASTVSIGDVRTNSSEVSVRVVNRTKTVISIKPSSGTKLHLIQFQRPLTPELRFFFVELVALDRHANIVIGVASDELLLKAKATTSGSYTNLIPGRVADTIGYESKTGLMFFNGKSKGNMMGHRCARGDCMSIEMEVFEEEMSVAIFGKNFRPVGTRFLTLKDAEQFLPTIAVQTSGGDSPIEINAYWHTVISNPPHFNVVSAFSFFYAYIFSYFLLRF